MKELTSEALLAMACAFEILPYDETHKRRGLRQIRVEARGKGMWAISGDYGVLNHDGEWEHEPFPSSRDDDFLIRCRWPSAIDAILFAQAHIQKYPIGYKPVTDQID